MNKFEFKKFYSDSTPCGDLGPKGDFGLKISNEMDFGFDYDPPRTKSKKQNDFDDIDNESIIDYDDYDYCTKGKKNDDYLEDEYELDPFGQVKNFYQSQIETNYIQKSKQAKLAALFFAGTVTFFIAWCGVIAYEGLNTNKTIYVASQHGGLIQDKKQVEINSSTVIHQKLLSHNKVESTPAVVNNYNFEKLNSGLTTLGYSLLACFLGMFTFKGLSILGKSFRIKKEIKRSKQLIENFKQTISNQDNQLSISHLINDQMVINNILIDRLNKNSHVVELIAINEKMKDTSQFINSRLLNNLKES